MRQKQTATMFALKATSFNRSSSKIAKSETYNFCLKMSFCFNISPETTLEFLEIGLAHILSCLNVYFLDLNAEKNLQKQMPVRDKSRRHGCQFQLQNFRFKLKKMIEKVC